VQEVIEWLQALRLVAGGSIHVFPKRRRDPRNRSLHVGIDTLNAALAEVEHGVPHFTLEGVYNTHDYLNERRVALEKWTAVLLAIESGERKITPMRRQVAG
jgi:hypothetical protein